MRTVLKRLYGVYDPLLHPSNVQYPIVFSFLALFVHSFIDWFWLTVSLRCLLPWHIRELRHFETLPTQFLCSQAFEVRVEVLERTVQRRGRGLHSDLLTPEDEWLAKAEKVYLRISDCAEEVTTWWRGPWKLQEAEIPRRSREPLNAPFVTFQYLATRWCALWLRLDLENSISRDEGDYAVAVRFQCRLLAMVYSACSLWVRWFYYLQFCEIIRTNKKNRLIRNLLAAVLYKLTEFIKYLLWRL